MNAETLGAEKAYGRTAPLPFHRGTHARSPETYMPWSQTPEGPIAAAPWCVTREALAAGRGRDEIRAARNAVGEGPLVLDLSEASPRDNRQARALLRLLADALDTGLELRLVGVDRDLQAALRLVGLGDAIALPNPSRTAASESPRS